MVDEGWGLWGKGVEQGGWCVWLIENRGLIGNLIESYVKMISAPPDPI